MCYMKIISRNVCGAKPEPSTICCATELILIATLTTNGTVCAVYVWSRYYLISKH